MTSLKFWFGSPVPPRPYVGARRHAEAGEGRAIKGHAIRQCSTGDIGLWHKKKPCSQEVANNADKVGGDAETIEFINWLALLLQSIGGIAAITLWAVVSLVILAIAWAITRLVGGPSMSQPPAHN